MNSTVQWKEIGLCVHVSQRGERHYLGLERDDGADQWNPAFLPSIPSDFERIENSSKRGSL